MYKQLLIQQLEDNQRDTETLRTLATIEAIEAGFARINEQLSCIADEFSMMSGEGAVDPAEEELLVRQAGAGEPEDCEGCS